MTKLVLLSERSIELMRQLHHPTNDAMSQVEIIAWLTKKTAEHDRSSRFLLASLRAALLEDLHDSFLSSVERQNKKDKEKTSWFSKFRYIFLAIAGTLFAICEGFDGSAAILGSFIAIPTAVIFAVGITFSFLSVGIFYGFRLVTISQLLGVNLWKSSQLLDVYLEQVEQIEKLETIINDRYTDEAIGTEGQQTLKSIHAMLVIRYEALDDARASYLIQLNAPALGVAKVITATMTAIIFFSGGFFAGQTLSIAIANLFLISASATLWPIVAVSALVGLAALSLYWFLERPGLEDLVSHWLGLDKDNIDTFANEEVVDQHKQGLNQLKSKMDQFEKLHQEIAELKAVSNPSSHECVAPPSQAGLETTVSSLHPSFFTRRRSQSLDDLRSHDDRIESKAF